MKKIQESLHFCMQYGATIHRNDMFEHRMPSYKSLTHLYNDLLPSTLGIALYLPGLCTPEKGGVKKESIDQKKDIVPQTCKGVREESTTRAKTGKRMDTSDIACIDQGDTKQCQEWKAEGRCKDESDFYMKAFCAQTCRFCGW
ncbi:shTK domain protein [Cooperia oncophora]